MAIILPQEGNVWQTLGEGLGAGLQKIAAGKVKQLQTKTFASQLAAAGYNPQIAYLPEKLQSLAIKQQDKQRESLLKSQKDADEFNYLANEALQIGGNREMVERALAVGGDAGKKMLNRIITAGSKGEKSLSIPQRIGFSAAPAKSPLLNDKSSFSYRYGQKQAAAQQVQAPQAGVNVLNTPIAQSVQPQQSGLQQNISTNENTQEPENIRLLKQAINDPSLTEEEKQMAREELMQITDPKTWTETFAGIIPNLATGAAANIGSGFNLPRLLEAALSPVARGIGSLIIPGELQRMQDQINEMPEGTEKQNLIDRYNTLKAEYENAPNQKYATASSASVKENYIRPLAEKIGVDRLITNPDYISSIAERVGAVASGYGLSAILQGSPVLESILTGVRRGATIEPIGEFLKRVAGPGWDAAFSLLGYTAYNAKPGLFKNDIKNKFEKARDYIKDKPQKWINGRTVLDRLDALENSLADKTSASSRFILKKIGEARKLVKKIPARQAKLGKFPRRAINSEQAANLDFDLGGDTFEEAQRIGKNTVQRLYELRDTLRQAYEPVYSAMGPKGAEVIKGVQTARKMTEALHHIDDVTAFMQKHAGGNKGFFNKFLYAIKTGFGAGAEYRKWKGIFEKSPELQKLFTDALKEAATESAGATETAIARFVNTFQSML